MPHFLRFGILALLALPLHSASMALQVRDFFVEVGPGAPPFFTGDVISFTVLSTNPGNVNPSVVEILSDGKVFVDYRGMTPSSGSVTRDGKRFAYTTLSLVVDEKFPPGIYQARARAGDATSATSEPFRVEPWGKVEAGVQVSLSAPAAVTSATLIPLTITLRNVGSGPLLVPSKGPSGCATPWLEFVIFDAGAATGHGLRDDRKDCQRQPRVLLQPKQTTSLEVDLTRWNEHGHAPRRAFRPAPGRYRIHVTVQGRYYEADPGGQLVWKDEALSNSVFIEIK